MPLLLPVVALQLACAVKPPLLTAEALWVASIETLPPAAWRMPPLLIFEFRWLVTAVILALVLVWMQELPLMASDYWESGLEAGTAWQDVQKSATVLAGQWMWRWMAVTVSEPQGPSFFHESLQTVGSYWTWPIWMRQFQPQFGTESDPAQHLLCSSVEVVNHDPSARQSFFGTVHAELMPGPDCLSPAEVPPYGQHEHQREGQKHLGQACEFCQHPATLPSASGWEAAGPSSSHHAVSAGQSRRTLSWIAAD